MVQMSEIGWPRCSASDDTSLGVQADTASGYAMDYAPPLGSSGWHCCAAHAGHDWHVFYCSLGRISWACGLTCAWSWRRRPAVEAIGLW